ncbi:MAG: RibD family protein [Leptospiraceae bacterium]|nr:RibD family protein [Leptospiraceae bacterium]
MAMTLDGKVARPDGKWYGLSSRDDKKRMDLYRSQSDALILGKNSLINDDPVIKLRYVNGKDPLPVILIRKGVVKRDRKVFSNLSMRPLVICLNTNEAIIRNELSEVAEILVLEGNNINPQKVISILKSRNLNQVLLEGGPTLNYTFQNADLIDVINLTIVPFIIGKKTLPAIMDGDSEFLHFAEKRWNLTMCDKVGDEIFLRYEKYTIDKKD